MKVLFPTLLSAAALLSAPGAYATTCPLDIARAYQKAAQRGWGFKCISANEALSGVKTGLHFDNAKRVGCYGRTGVVPTTYFFEALFFLRPGKPGQAGALSNGWRVATQDTVVAGGPANILLPYQDSPQPRVKFSWTSTAVNQQSYRYLSKMLVTKNAGDCTQVYDEAFE